VRINETALSGGTPETLVVREARKPLGTDLPLQSTTAPLLLWGSRRVETPSEVGCLGCNLPSANLPLTIFPCVMNVNDEHDELTSTTNMDAGGSVHHLERSRSPIACNGMSSEKHFSRRSVGRFFDTSPSLLVAPFLLGGLTVVAGRGAAR
jgi:hypothetical protein